MSSDPMCACGHVEFAPIDNGNGTKSDRWRCVMCRREFVPGVALEQLQGELDEVRAEKTSEYTTRLQGTISQLEQDVSLARSALGVAKDIHQAHVDWLVVTGLQQAADNYLLKRDRHKWKVKLAQLARRTPAVVMEVIDVIRPNKNRNEYSREAVSKALEQFDWAAKENLKGAAVLLEMKSNEADRLRKQRDEARVEAECLRVREAALRDSIGCRLEETHEQYSRATAEEEASLEAYYDAERIVDEEFAREAETEVVRVHADEHGIWSGNSVDSSRYEYHFLTEHDLNGKTTILVCEVTDRELLQTKSVPLEDKK